jgi:hypothetical protein
LPAAALLRGEGTYRAASVNERLYRIFHTSLKNGDRLRCPKPDDSESTSSVSGGAWTALPVTVFQYTLHIQWPTAQLRSFAD